MRHNYVTMCWESGIDVYTASKLVGHKSIKTTMDIYTHLSERQMEKAIQDVANMFGRR
jgi:site-specific recombinase XerD